MNLWLLPAVSGLIINFYSRLYVIYKNVKGYVLILYRFRFHFHTAGHKFFSCKNRSNAIHTGIPGTVYIICHFILKRQHSGYIKIPGSRDQIFFICILPGKLITDQMTAIIKISAIYIINFTVCQPVGLIIPIAPRSSVGISWGVILDSAYPHRPRASSSL